MRAETLHITASLVKLSEHLIVESVTGRLQNVTAEAVALGMLCLHFSNLLVFFVCFHPKVRDSAGSLAAKQIEMLPRTSICCGGCL